jgi:hypothetical protein
MGQSAKSPRQNRTITVDFHDETTYAALIGNPKAFVEFVLAFLLSRFSAPPQGQLQRGREPDAPLPLCPYPLGRPHHLAGPVHHMPSGVHGPPPLRLALSSDATGRGPRCLVGDPRRSEFGAVCGDLPCLPDGSLSPGMCFGPPGAGNGADAVWVTLAHVFPGRREA